MEYALCLKLTSQRRGFKYVNAIGGAARGCEGTDYSTGGTLRVVR